MTELNARYFKRKEFACKCGCGYAAVSPELVRRLEEAREEAGVPFIITSGCRCGEHNASVGGVRDSAHVKGLAVDIAAAGANRERIKAALEKHFTRRGIGKTFIHVDVDTSKPDAVWKY